MVGGVGLYDRRHATSGHRARRRHRRAPLWCTASPRASAAPPRRGSCRAAAVLLVLDGRQRDEADPLRHAGLPAGRARRGDRHADPDRSARTVGRSEGGGRLRHRPADRSDRRRDRPACDADDRRRRRSSSARRSAKATPPRTHNNTKGLVQAFDVRTGKRLWNFNTIPRPGEFGNETWEENSWAFNGNTGVWNQMAVDEELGLVYLPVETPSVRLLRRPSARQQPLRREPRRRRSEDRQPQVAFPARAPSALEHGHLDGADPRRHHRRRPAGQSRVDHGQAGDGLRVRSRHRTAGVADRGTSGAAVGDVPGEKYSARRSRFRPSRRPTITRA